MLSGIAVLLQLSTHNYLIWCRALFRLSRKMQAQDTYALQKDNTLQRTSERSSTEH